jgi:hypothetical protein
MTRNSRATLADQDSLFFSSTWISKYAVLSIMLYGDMSKAFDILEKDRKKAKP